MEGTISGSGRAKKDLLPFTEPEKPRSGLQTHGLRFYLGDHSRRLIEPFTSRS